jgi:hypothetical protein
MGFFTSLASNVVPPSPRRLRFLLYQLTHPTKDRGSLTHDDRVDAVAGAVAHFQRAMMIDVDQAAKASVPLERLVEICWGRPDMAAGNRPIVGQSRIPS